MQAKHWHLLENGKIQCDICPRHCQLQPGQRGFCFVRAREGDTIVLSTYGRSSGFCLDPVEKKPLYHFLPGSPILSFGTAGCNLGCKFCQNSDISKVRQMDVLMHQAAPQQIAQAAKLSGAQSVAFTYNDPVIFYEYAIDSARACHELGIKTVAVTAGYICPEPAKEFFSVMDAANVDLKAFTDNFYQKLCSATLQPVLETLKYIKQHTRCWLEITTLLIPGENDSATELKQLCHWVKEELGSDVPLHFSAFHPDYHMQTHPRTSHQTLLKAADIAQTAGLRYVYLGNVHDVSGDSTQCSGCGKSVIVRDWYEILEYHLTEEGNCQFCGTSCPGVFQGPCGDWGSQRRTVQI